MAHRSGGVAGAGCRPLAWQRILVSGAASVASTAAATGTTTFSAVVAVGMGVTGAVSETQAVQTEICNGWDTFLKEPNEALWAPAVVLQSLRVPVAKWRPPLIGQESPDVELVGLCTLDSFASSAFSWLVPSSKGGDFIAEMTNRTGGVQLVIGSGDEFNNAPGIHKTSCQLTHLALDAWSGSPNLRLQFADCEVKAAFTAPLRRAGTGEDGLRIVNWVCGVTGGTSLCKEAAASVNATTPKGLQQLDLSLVASAASAGMKRMQISMDEGQDCLKTGRLNWLQADHTVAVDGAEWDMLLAILKTRAPSENISSTILANVVVDRVCAPDCHGNMIRDCYTRVQDADAGAVDGTCDLICSITENWTIIPLLILCLLLFFAVGLCAGFGVTWAIYGPSQEEKLRAPQEVRVRYAQLPEEIATQ
eukprot:TRINITY_DN46198_c0_g1_i1.p1 TRINITY_DN46198_c0_g1~~TRINITY_DN46198_c0_g1_i1.p1  ORF type:complete len:420 (+),score=64.95 TRINITY_DN46198_c0_g1_i1:33-1292(+)